MKKLILLLAALVLPIAAHAQSSQLINGSRVLPSGSSLRMQVVNDGSTGTTVNLLAKLTSTGAILATTSDTTLPTFIVETGAGTTNSAELAVIGHGNCIMDTTTSNTEGFYVIASVTTNGRCHAQSSAPTAYIVGSMVSNSTTAGSAAVVQVIGSFNIAGAGSGTVTSIATTFPLSGGTITSSGTIACNPCVQSAAALTDLSPVIGSGGGQGTKTVAGLTTDGVSVHILGVAGTSVGGWDLKNATSGTLSVRPPTGAMGSVTNTLQAVTDTFVYKATTDILTNKTINASNNTLSNITGAMMTNNTVASTQMAVVNTRHVCDIVVGDTSGAVITNAQLGPQKRACYIPAASTIVEMDVSADAGTPNVIVAKNTAGTVLNIVSGALATAASGGIACSNTGGTTGIDGATTCSATLQNTAIGAGAYLELVSGTAGGTAKLMTIHVVYTIN